jgi:hypothetical protein
VKRLPFSCGLRNDPKGMLVPSHLRDTTLGDVLAVLHRNFASGVLEIDDTRSRHAIHVRRGLVCAVEVSNPSLRFGGVAVTYKACDPQVIEHLAQTEAVRPLRLGQRLVMAGILSVRDRDDVLHTQRIKRLERLFYVEDAELRFEDVRALPPGSAELAPMSARDVFFGRRRHRDGASLMRIHALGVLGLNANATITEVRERYRERVAMLHPDHTGHLDQATREAMLRELRAVIEAYRALL